MLIVLLVITIEINIINNYKIKINNDQKTLNTLQEITVVDNLVSKYNNNTINKDNLFDISN